MTLREAIENAETLYHECIAVPLAPDALDALRMVIEAAKQQNDDTVEIVTLTEAKK